MKLWPIVVTLVILMSAIFFSLQARAANTMDLVDEYRNGSKKICVYSDGRNTATTTKSLAGACPSKHTFH